MKEPFFTIFILSLSLCLSLSLTCCKYWNTIPAPFKGGKTLIDICIFHEWKWIWYKTVILKNITKYYKNVTDDGGGDVVVLLMTMIMMMMKVTE